MRSFVIDEQVKKIVVKTNKEAKGKERREKKVIREEGDRRTNLFHIVYKC